MEENQQKSETPEWQYQSGQLEQTAVPADNTPHQGHKGPLVSWSASEFVSHEKAASWYLFLGIIAVVVAGAIFLITREVFSTIVVIVLAAALAVFGNLKPRTLEYVIDESGIQIGDKFLAYSDLRSFAVVEDDASMPSIQLLPQRRFMVPITVYFAPPDEDIIVSTLGNFLPFEHKKRDAVERWSSRIRF